MITGATGCIGGRLLPLLSVAGWHVRCLARRPENLVLRVPAGVDVQRGDVLDGDSSRVALTGVEAAFYPVHSLGGDRQP